MSNFKSLIKISSGIVVVLILLQIAIMVHGFQKPVFFAANTEWIPLMRYLLAHGVSVNERNHGDWDISGMHFGGGSTPQHFAASEGRTKMVAYLIDHGADVNVVNAEGQTPLQWAVIGGQLSIVKSLLAHGATVDHVDGQGDSALDYAISQRT